MAEPLKILVIDDQTGVIGSDEHQAFIIKYGGLGYRFVFSTAEESSGVYSVSSALSSVEYNSDAALVLLDIKFGKESNRLGIEILAEIVARYPKIPVVMMTSLETEPASVVKCMRLRARDYISTSPPPEELTNVIETFARRVTESHPILGDSPKIKELRRQIEQVAQNASVSVLVLGERGTGKELVARNIHYLGRRRNAPFVAVNCAAVSKDILSAELFGAEKGAYTGAYKTKYGYIELANGGVLFLDEIGEMDISVQAMLLRVLEERCFRRVGVSTAEISVDFQLICATNADLTQMVRDGRFRADLYDRIKNFEIRTPPLRECREDIERLAKYALRQVQDAPGGLSYHITGFDSEVIERFRAYSWPGNVRELRNAVEGAMIRAAGERIRLKDLPAEVTGSPRKEAGSLDLPPEGMDLNLLMAELELSHLLAAYLAAGRIKSKAIRLYYPGYHDNYFDRIIYEAVQRGPAAFEKFPEFKSFYEKEKARREGK